MLNVAYIAGLLIQALALIIGLCVHESAHALAAWVLGDKTARSRGRVSLNPLAHIDPFGTVLLPLIMIVLGGPVFAFAKPVPVYLGNLKNPKRDALIVALAGPASNIVLAVVFAALCRVPAVGSLVMTTGSTLPLECSSILVPFLKGRALETYYQIQQYAMPILIIVLYLLPQILRIDIVGAYFNFTVYPLFYQLAAWALG